MKSYKISDGISVNYIEDKKFKTTTLFIAISTPLREDDATKNALIPLVLKRGSANYKTFDEIERKLADLYGATLDFNVVKRGENQVLCFGVSMVCDKFTPTNEEVLTEAAGLLFDVLFNPQISDESFNFEYVEAEKRNLYEMIEAMVNDKQSYALWRLYEEMCRGEAFGINELGRKEDISKIDGKGLFKQYKKLISSSPIDIFVCGQANIDEFDKMTKKYLENLPSGERKYPKTEPHKARETVLEEKEEFDANQAKLSLGFSTGVKRGTDRYYSLIVANSIFGSGTHSKLFNNVREKLSLAYYAFSRIDARKETMLVGMGIEEKNYKKALDETLLQLQLIKDGNISEEEFNSAIAFLINNAKSVYDSQSAMIMFNLNNKIDGEEMTVEEYCEKIKAVTVESVIDAFSDVNLDTIYFLKGKERDK